MCDLNTCPYLVFTDVDAIQSYLFSSVRLATIAGASRVVVEFDKWVEDTAESDKFDGCVLAHSGGSATILFSDADKAKKFTTEAQKKFATHSVSGHLTTAGPVDCQKHTDTIEKTAFQQAMEEAARELEQRKRSGFQRDENAANPFARRCALCSREPAIAYERNVAPDDDQPGTRFIGATCRQKWMRRGQRQLRQRDPHQFHQDDLVTAEDWLDWLIATEDPPWQDLDFDTNLPREFSHITGEREKLALVLADVNGVGERRRLCKQPEKLKRFSENLQSALQKSLTDAVREAAADAQFDGTNRLPLMVLFHGGDDLVLACQAPLALPLMERLVDRFADLNTNQTWNGGNPLGLSASAVITGGSFPFRIAHQIGTRLLGEAKRTAREHVRNDATWQHGAIDFVVVSEAYGDAETILRDRGIRSTSMSLQLTGRPFCAGKESPRSFAKFREACEQLRDFPSRRLHELRRICSGKTLDLPEDPTRFRAVREGIDKWQNEYEGWRHRLERNPGLAATWRDVCNALELSFDEGWLSGASGPAYRTCVGDFADAIKLGNQQDAD